MIKRCVEHLNGKNGFNAIVHALFNSRFGLFIVIVDVDVVIWILSTFFCSFTDSAGCFNFRNAFGFGCIRLWKEWKRVECVCVVCAYWKRIYEMLLGENFIYPLPQTWHSPNMNAIQRLCEAQWFAGTGMWVYICFGRACSDFDCMLNNNFVAIFLKHLFTLGEWGTQRSVWHSELALWWLHKINFQWVYKNVEMFCGEALFQLATFSIRTFLYVPWRHTLYSQSLAIWFFSLVLGFNRTEFRFPNHFQTIKARKRGKLAKCVLVHFTLRNENRVTALETTTRTGGMNELVARQVASNIIKTDCFSW